MKRKYSDNDIIVAVKSSKHISDVLRKIGLRQTGGNFSNIKKHFLRLDLDISHFTGKSQKLNHYEQNRKNYIPFRDSKNLNSVIAKRKILLEKIKKYQCENCLLITWQNNKIPLELHHIDGNTFNNNVENLQLLCPNCHALTNNYRGRKKKQKNNEKWTYSEM